MFSRGHSTARAKLGTATGADLPAHPALNWARAKQSFVLQVLREGAAKQHHVPLLCWARLAESCKSQEQGGGVHGHHGGAVQKARGFEAAAEEHEGLPKGWVGEVPCLTQCSPTIGVPQACKDSRRRLPVITGSRSCEKPEPELDLASLQLRLTRRENGSCFA